MSEGRIMALVKQAIAAREGSLPPFAARLGVSHSWLAKVARDRIKPSCTRAEAIIADRFGPLYCRDEIAVVLEAHCSDRAVAAILADLAKLDEDTERAPAA